MLVFPGFISKISTVDNISIGEIFEVVVENDGTLSPSDNVSSVISFEADTQDETGTALKATADITIEFDRKVANIQVFHNDRELEG